MGQTYFNLITIRLEGPMIQEMSELTFYLKKEQKLHIINF